MDAYELRDASQPFDRLQRTERPTPEPGPGQVRVRLEAASLNYRDLSILRGRYPGASTDDPFIPLSDGAGKVDAVGEGVTTFEPGDRVAGLFAQPPVDAPATADPVPLGSPLDGTLAEYRVSHEAGLVALPDHLSYEEGATLPCAGLTAWHALFGIGSPLRAGETVLTLGTGGVSLFALQFAQAAGARVLITSSSDEKRERAHELGADDSVNYEDVPDWHEAVLEKTNGHGADWIVEVGGAGTLGRSLQTVAETGTIALIGVLSETDEHPSPYPLMQKRARLEGVFVGTIEQPKSAFQAMNDAIAVNEIGPIIDRVFPFDEATEAYRYLASGAHMGKVVISI
jgi:NADPH:quinone reductase-like Zn-dependent oxidoreductase